MEIHKESRNMNYTVNGMKPEPVLETGACMLTGLDGYLCYVKSLQPAAFQSVYLHRNSYTTKTLSHWVITVTYFRLFL